MRAKRLILIIIRHEQYVRNHFCVIPEIHMSALMAMPILSAGNQTRMVAPSIANEVSFELIFQCKYASQNVNDIASGIIILHAGIVGQRRIFFDFAAPRHV